MQKLSLIVLACLLAACAPSTDAINTAIAETQAAQPLASSTPIRTQPVTPINFPTETPTMTPAPTNTALSTPEPGTRTAVAATAIKSTANVQATATALYKILEVTQIASYSKPTTSHFIAYPNNYKGEHIQIRGRVFNINGSSQYQILTEGRAQEFLLRIDGGQYSAMVVMQEPFSDIFENNWVIVYGVGAGEHCDKDSSGQEVCQPLIMGDFYKFYQTNK